VLSFEKNILSVAVLGVLWDFFFTSFLLHANSPDSWKDVLSLFCPAGSCSMSVNVVGPTPHVAELLAVVKLRVNIPVFLRLNFDCNMAKAC
jgi:hypothetical protein